MDYNFKLYDFAISTNNSNSLEYSSEDDGIHTKDNKTFIIQMFGLNEEGKEASIIVEDYQPFFYVKVGNSWGQTRKTAFLNHIKAKIGKYWENSITDCKLIERKKLYGFDAGKKHRFIEFKFANTQAYNKVKNLWYTNETTDDNTGEKERRLSKNGYEFENVSTELYEANIPPLLRFFHIKEISPSGWISLPAKKVREITGDNKTTSCDYEFVINFKHIIPLNDKETRVPYKIMSFDIEASSSNGDFPVPIKTYKRLASDIVGRILNSSNDNIVDQLTDLIKIAFGYKENVYHDFNQFAFPKTKISGIDELNERIRNLLTAKLYEKEVNSNETLIESLFEKAYSASKQEDKEKEEDTGSNDGTDDENDIPFVDEVSEKFLGKSFNPYQLGQQIDNSQTIVQALSSKKWDKQELIFELQGLLKRYFPPLEGDKVTFIGSTFVRYGEKEPYLNHCIVLNSCDKLLSENTIIETYNTEQEVLLAWTKLMHRENPQVVIGYNIFGFDYEFMFRRAQELNCVEDFLKLSKNNDELCCAVPDYRDPTKIDIERSSTTLASGTYELSIIKMTGRLQVDMLNWFRRTENLTSYKLDYVAGYYIGDDVKSLIHPENENITRVYTTNLTGLQEESFIHFEEINHSSDYYKGGAKFKVIKLNLQEKWFEINGKEEPKAKKVKWGLAKDDVSPKDIFRMTNEGPQSRSIIAKYCIQDCNLVQHLFTKVDVMTDLIEMAKLCSVPMSFLVFRGQGIKLTSYVAKKCREKGVLMPVINKGNKDEGYEGAIVLQPKCGLYLEDPVCVGDFASLYPSSMLSENLCPSSKVWTKIFDLNGKLVGETGIKNENGTYIYDNLPGIEYVDIQFDTYRYVKKTPKAKKAEKVKSGHKICRFAQPTYDENGKEEKAIMPSILQELLKARKDTRKLIPQQSDEFIKNILDKRQLAYKVTANSLYGQLGAKTSTFYEPDIASATTATGRLLLTYAKKVVEECYKDTDVETKHGLMNTKAEYVYGDSVASWTPIPIRHSQTHELNYYTIEEIADNFSVEKINIWKKCLDEGRQEKEYCELYCAETWTEKGWTPVYRVIRHRLASHKKMYRISTPKGVVDVTDDHSLLHIDGTELSPKSVDLGTRLMHQPINTLFPVNYRPSINALCSLLGVQNNDIEPNFVVPYFNNGSNEKISFNIGTTCQLNLAKIFYEANKRGYTAFINPTENRRLILTIDKTNKIKVNNPIAVNYMEEIKYDGYVYDLTTENHHFAAGIGNIIVHNTDSVFFTFHLTDKKTGEKVIGEKALEISIEIAQEATHNVSKFLKQPHDFEYEKTFMPFCLLSKKRYVSIKYEFDPKKGKRNEMGIVLKRRDNAPIVKDVYGGVIDILMKEKNVQMAIDYVHKCLRDLVDGKVPIEKLIITKSLRSYYKDPLAIAHKVLADRIATRDPGNKPASGDRIPFVYIVTKPVKKGEKELQGNKIETPSYIQENKLKIDYSFYITNQIMKPLAQLFGLVLYDMLKERGRLSEAIQLENKIKKIQKEQHDFKKCLDKINDVRLEKVKELIFDEYLRETNNTKNGNQAITSFFKTKK